MYSWDAELVYISRSIDLEIDVSQDYGIHTINMYAFREYESTDV